MLIVVNGTNVDNTGVAGDGEPLFREFLMRNVATLYKAVEVGVPGPAIFSELDLKSSNTADAVLFPKIASPEFGEALIKPGYLVAEAQVGMTYRDREKPHDLAVVMQVLTNISLDYGCEGSVAGTAETVVTVGSDDSVAVGAG